MARLKDIADKVGLSISTVSRVINHDPSFSISLENRQRILQVAEEYQYPVNEAPKVRESWPVEGSVGLVLLYNEVDEVEDPYYLSIRTNFKAECLRLGLETTEYYHYHHDRPLSLGDHSLLVFIGSGAFWTPLIEDQIKKTATLPIIVDFRVKDFNADFVLTNFEELMDKALSYLISQGFTKIGFIGSRDLNITQNSYIQDDRERFFSKILTEKGLFNPGYVHISSNTTLADGYSLAKEAVNRSDIPEVFFVETDTMAIGVIKALKENGFSVPEDISVISCNDIPEAEYLNPALTTMRINTHLMGIMAARLAAERVLLKRKTPIKLFVPNELVIRQSCLPRKAQK